MRTNPRRGLALVSIKNQKAFPSTRLGQCLACHLHAIRVRCRRLRIHIVCGFVFYRCSGKRDSDAGCHTDYIHNKSHENTRTLYQIHCYNSIVFSVICVRPCTATEMYATICMCVAPYSTEFTIYRSVHTPHPHRIHFTLLLIYFSRESIFSSLLKTLQKHFVWHNERRATGVCMQ